MTFRILAACITLASSTSALAQTAVSPKDVTAEDVVTKPLSDMNLKKEEVPPVLIAAQDHPYSLAGLKTCKAVQAEVGRLDAVLGDDIDVAEEQSRGSKRGNSVGNIAKSIVGSLIPFGGIIREISGANANERQWQMAIYAGSARRAYLKGYGQQRGCRYPARAASATDIAMLQKARVAEEARKDAAKSKDKDQDSGQRNDGKKNDGKSGDLRMTSTPVVQKIPSQR